MSVAQLDCNSNAINQFGNIQKDFKLSNTWHMFNISGYVMCFLESCASWILTIPGPAPSQKPSRRPGGGWRPGSWLWPTQARQSHGWSPSGSLGLSVSSSWTLQHTRDPCISPHTFWPQQTSPWKTRTTWAPYTQWSCLSKDGTVDAHCTNKYINAELS